MTNTSIPADIRDRIFAAADDIYQQSDRESLPTVDQVRRAARVDMNAASAVMREWRRKHIFKPSPVAVTVPETVAQASSQLLAQLWTQAQELANESLRSAQAGWETERAELEQMRTEIAEAFEAQANELTDIQARAEAMTTQAREATTRADAELVRLRDELSKSVGRADRAEAAAAELRTDADRLRSQLSELGQKLDVASTRERERVEEAATAKAEAARLAAQLKDQKARSVEVIGKLEKSKQGLEADLSATRKEAREAAAQLGRTQGELEALRTQVASLNDTIRRLADQGGAKGKGGGQ